MCSSRRTARPSLHAAGLGPCDPKVRPTQDSIRETVELLLASGADVNGPDANGTTPLMYAGINGCDRVVMRTLIKAGARIGDKNKGGMDAFSFGIHGGLDALEELAAAGYRLPAREAQELIKTYGDSRLRRRGAQGHGHGEAGAGSRGRAKKPAP